MLVISTTKRLQTFRCDNQSNKSISFGLAGIIKGINAPFFYSMQEKCTLL